jgi:hypothetical protein
MYDFYEKYFQLLKLQYSVRMRLKIALAPRDEKNAGFLTITGFLKIM